MPTILVVDDSEVDRRLMGGLLERAGHRVAYASDGSEALAFLDHSVPDLILTDLLMPRMDGLELVRAVRGRFPFVPVILITGQGSEALAVEALKQGAASYVPKRHVAEILASTVEEVLRVARLDRDHEKLLSCLNRSEFTFFMELENDLSLVEPLVRLVKQAVGCMGLCDGTGQVRIGVALKQAVLNAMLRGNLELGSQPIDMANPEHAAMIEQRRSQLPFRDRRVLVDVKISTEEARFVIRDEGPGFDQASVPDVVDTVGEQPPPGRGLALMRAFMDEVTFNDQGNQVTLVKRW